MSNEDIKITLASESTEDSTSSQISSGQITPRYLGRKPKRKIKRTCSLCRWGHLHVDYKDVEFLKRRFLKNNKIITHKITGNCLKHQKQVATAIKRARIVALLPFVED